MMQKSEKNICNYDVWILVPLMLEEGTGHSECYAKKIKRTSS